MSRKSASLMVLVALCAGTLAATAVGSIKKHHAKSPIIIGAVISKTGFMSGYDGPPLQGVQLAVRDINAKGGVLGRPLKVEVFDQKSQPALGATGAQQLIQGGAKALIVACDYDIGGPAALVGNQKHIPAMSTCAGDAKFGVQGIGPYAYTMANTANYEGAALADWAYRIKKWRRAYIITDTGLQYTKDVAKYTGQVFAKLGGKIVGQDTMSSADPSISAQITRLKSVHPAPNFVVLSAYVPDLSSAVKQIRAAGVKLPLIGGAGWDGTYWTKGLPTANLFHGALGFVDGPAIRSEWAIAKKYIKTYHQKPVNAYFLTGYADIQAIAEAIKRAGTTSGPKVNAKLESLHKFPTVMGPLTFTKTTHNPTSYPEVIVTYVGHKQKFVMKYFPKNVPNPFK